MDNVQRKTLNTKESEEWKVRVAKEWKAAKEGQFKGLPIIAPHL